MSRDEVITKVLAGERLIFPKQVPKAFQVRQHSHHRVCSLHAGPTHCSARLEISGHQAFLLTRYRPLLMTAWPQMSLVARQQERFSDRWSDCRLRQMQAQLRPGMQSNVTRCSEVSHGPLFVCA